MGRGGACAEDRGPGCRQEPPEGRLLWASHPASKPGRSWACSVLDAAPRPTPLEWKSEPPGTSGGADFRPARWAAGDLSTLGNGPCGLGIDRLPPRSHVVPRE